MSEAISNRLWSQVVSHDLERYENHDKKIVARSDLAARVLSVVMNLTIFSLIFVGAYAGVSIWVPAGIGLGSSLIFPLTIVYLKSRVVPVKEKYESTRIFKELLVDGTALPNHLGFLEAYYGEDLAIDQSRYSQLAKQTLRRKRQLDYRLFQHNKFNKEIAAKMPASSLQETKLRCDALGIDWTPSAKRIAAERLTNQDAFWKEAQALVAQSRNALRRGDDQAYLDGSAQVELFLKSTNPLVDELQQVVVDHSNGPTPQQQDTFNRCAQKVFFEAAGKSTLSPREGVLLEGDILFRTKMKQKLENLASEVQDEDPVVAAMLRKEAESWIAGPNNPLQYKTLLADVLSQQPAEYAHFIENMKRQHKEVLESLQAQYEGLLDQGAYALSQLSQDAILDTEQMVLARKQIRYWEALVEGGPLSEPFSEPLSNNEDSAEWAARANELLIEELEKAVCFAGMSARVGDELEGHYQKNRWQTLNSRYRRYQQLYNENIELRTEEKLELLQLDETIELQESEKRKPLADIGLIEIEREIAQLQRENRDRGCVVSKTFRAQKKRQERELKNLKKAAELRGVAESEIEQLEERFKHLQRDDLHEFKSEVLAVRNVVHPTETDQTRLWNFPKESERLTSGDRTMRAIDRKIYRLDKTCKNTYLYAVSLAIRVIAIPAIIIAMFTVTGGAQVALLTAAFGLHLLTQPLEAKIEKWQEEIEETRLAARLHTHFPRAELSGHLACLDLANQELTAARLALGGKLLSSSISKRRQSGVDTHRNWR